MALQKSLERVSRCKTYTKQQHGKANTDRHSRGKKVGTDILDNKCSWNINVALENATKEQRQILDENYGKKDAKSEAKVKELFNAQNIDVEGRFKKYEAESHERLMKMIESIEEREGLKKQVFIEFLNKVYKRTK